MIDVQTRELAAARKAWQRDEPHLHGFLAWRRGEKQYPQAEEATEQRRLDWWYGLAEAREQSIGWVRKAWPAGALSWVLWAAEGRR